MSASHTQWNSEWKLVLYPWRDYILLPSRVKRCRVIATPYFSLSSTCLNICLLYLSRNNHVIYRITKLYSFHIPCTNLVNSNREGKILWVWCGEFFLYEIKSTSNKCKKGMWDLILRFLQERIWVQSSKQVPQNSSIHLPIYMPPYSTHCYTPCGF